MKLFSLLFLLAGICPLPSTGQTLSESSTSTKSDPNFCSPKKKCPLTLVDDVFQFVLAYQDAQLGDTSDARGRSEVPTKEYFKAVILDILKASFRDKNDKPTLIPGFVSHFDNLYELNFEAQEVIFEALLKHLASNDLPGVRRLHDLLQMAHFALGHDSEQVQAYIEQELKSEKLETITAELEALHDKNMKELQNNKAFEKKLKDFEKKFFKKEKIKEISFDSEYFGKSNIEREKNLQAIQVIYQHAVDKLLEVFPQINTKIIDEFDRTRTFTPSDVKKTLDGDGYLYHFDSELKPIDSFKRDKNTGKLILDKKGKKQYLPERDLSYAYKVKLTLVDGQVLGKVKIKTLREQKKVSHYILPKDFDVESPKFKQFLSRQLIEDGAKESFWNANKHYYNSLVYLEDKTLAFFKDIFAQRGASAVLLQADQTGRLLDTAYLDPRPTYLSPQYFKHQLRSKGIKPNSWGLFALGGVSAIWETSFVYLMGQIIGSNPGADLLLYTGGVSLGMGLLQPTYRNLLYSGTTASQWFRMLMFPGIPYAYMLAHLNDVDVFKMGDFNHFWNVHLLLWSSTAFNSWAKTSWRGFNDLLKRARLGTQEAKIGNYTWKDVKSADLAELIVGQGPRMAKYTVNLSVGHIENAFIASSLLYLSVRQFGNLVTTYAGENMLKKARKNGYHIPTQAHNVIRIYKKRPIVKATESIKSLFTANSNSVELKNSLDAFLKLPYKLKTSFEKTLKDLPGKVVVIKAPYTKAIDIRESRSWERARSQNCSQKFLGP